jgi:8-oxo-dGTP pyrophosphatase MutT (NUDIX family)
LDLLDAYREQHPSERACVARISQLVDTHPNCYERNCWHGHITASVWIASPDHQQFLLTHHRKLRRWLQLGGHADGDSDVRRVALREAREESGMRDFDFARDSSGLDLIDVDVHRIPAFRDDPPHDHHDLRFCLVARPGQTVHVSEESHDVAWFDLVELETQLDEVSLLRLGRKCRALLGRAG